jgi:hypothetical protein
LCATLDDTALAAAPGLPAHADVAADCDLDEVTTACVLRSCEFGYESNRGSGTLVCDVRDAMNGGAASSALSYAAGTPLGLFCSPLVCKPPASTDGYVLQERQTALLDFDVGASCGTGYIGQAQVSSCGLFGEFYEISGCVACPEGTTAAASGGCSCDAGFSGSVTAITADPFYTSTCTALACDPATFVDDAATDYFTADCSGQTSDGSTCTLSYATGYGGGSVTCNTAVDPAVYDVVPATGCTVDTPYDGCTTAVCTAVDTPYAGCTTAVCTAVDTPYAGCTTAVCTAVDTP